MNCPCRNCCQAVRLPIPLQAGLEQKGCRFQLLLECVSTDNTKVLRHPLAGTERLAVETLVQTARVGRTLAGQCEPHQRFIL